jgi:peptidoglycan/LPS O-acetylase OafA/YrhL
VRRLHSLDALRGIAALSVVFWHWQHFHAISGIYETGWRADAQPFYWTFRLFYDQGWAAVDLFFPLSGFIFFWLYGEAIRTRRVGAGEFALLRFSRLYPLHLATLLVAAALQVLFLRRTGSWFIYADNDWQHFVSALLMAQQWLPPNIDQIFNGPAWSVSIEVLLYGIFFCVLRVGLGTGSVSLVIAAASVLLVPWNEFIARGLMGFFVGGAVFSLSERIKLHRRVRTIAQAIGLIALGIWVLIVVEVYAAPLHGLCYWIAGHISASAGRLYLGWNGWLFRLLFTFVASPLTILALALDEQVLGGRYKRLSPLGDISYSTYLLHFPMQLALALMALSLGLHSSVFETRPAMMAFFSALILLGMVSYRYFERPFQILMRGFARTRLSPAEQLDQSRAERRGVW